MVWFFIFNYKCLSCYKYFTSFYYETI